MAIFSYLFSLRSSALSADINIKKISFFLLTFPPPKTAQKQRFPKIPKKLFDEIKLIMEKRAYPSVASFIAEAVREKIESIERLQIDKLKYPPFRNSQQSGQEDRPPAD